MWCFGLASTVNYTNYSLIWCLVKIDLHWIMALELDPVVSFERILAWRYNVVNCKFHLTIQFDSLVMQESLRKSCTSTSHQLIDNIQRNRKQKAEHNLKKCKLDSLVVVVMWNSDWLKGWEFKGKLNKKNFKLEIEMNPVPFRNRQQGWVVLTTATTGNVVMW